MKHRRWTGVSLVVLLVAVSIGSQELPGERELAILGEPSGGARSGEDLARATEDVSSRMRCPVCQGLSVAASSAPSAVAMKAKAEKLLAQGYDGEQVLIYFERSYGEFIRLEPRAEGFNLLVWILPALALALGGTLIWRRVRSGSDSSRGAERVEEDAELAAYRERVRQEVDL